MKISNNMLTREADLSFEELERLAEEIRTLITGGRAFPIREYIRVVSSIDSEIFGYRKGRAILFEPKLESYFPDEVFEALRKKGREQRGHHFNREDDKFIIENISKGIEWLKDRFYTDGHTIYGRIEKLGIVDELTNYDFLHLKKLEKDE
jgi:hypothetical protein